MVFGHRPKICGPTKLLLPTSICPFFIFLIIDMPHFYVRRTFFSFMYIMMLRDQDELVEINVERQHFKHFNVKVGMRANSLKC